MGYFLDAARQSLEALGRPASAKELTELAIDHGWLVSQGRTPAQTMKSKLSTDIRTHRDDSLFMRTSAGLFGLRWWKGSLGEFHAKRFVASLLDEDVLVFPRQSLTKYIPGAGIYTSPIASRELLSECVPMQRRIAEDHATVV